MRPVKSFVVKASIPKALEFLREIAYNLYWYWNINAVKLFYRLERNLWEDKYHNPVSILGGISQEQYEVLARNEGIQAELKRIKNDFDNYLKGSTWYSKNFPELSERQTKLLSRETQGLWGEEIMQEVKRFIKTGKINKNSGFPYRNPITGELQEYLFNPYDLGKKLRNQGFVVTTLQPILPIDYTKNGRNLIRHFLKPFNRFIFKYYSRGFEIVAEKQR